MPECSNGHRLRSAAYVALNVLVFLSFIFAITIYWWFAKTDDILYILPLFLLPILQAVLGWWSPTSVSKFSGFVSSLSLLVIGLCWICFAWCRAEGKGFVEGTYPKLAEVLSVFALSFTFLLMGTVWFTIKKLVRRPEAATSETQPDWNEELRKFPTYSLLLLFSTLWQVICLLGFSLALHDFPMGRGLRVAGEEIDLGTLIWRTASTKIEIVYDETVASEVKRIIGLLKTHGTASRASICLTLPLEADFRSEKTRELVEEAVAFLYGLIGNNAVEVQVRHAATTPTPTPTAKVETRDNDEQAQPSGVLKISIFESHEPQLLDYLYFMTSTLVTTGYCDLIPVSNYSKLLCTVANIYEVFFTVVFFSIVISVLITRDKGGSPPPGKDDDSSIKAEVTPE